MPPCSHALDTVKTGRSKGWVLRFMPTISQKENGLKTREKNVRSNVLLCYNYVDLTDASGFNGVEQCEKCLSWYNSKVHHTTFIWISLCFSTFSLSQFLCFSCSTPSHSYFDLFLLYVKTSSCLTAICTIYFFVIFIQNSLHTIVCPLACVLNWLNPKCIKSNLSLSSNC